MRDFAARFAPINARTEQLQTCYAMAEAVFAVTQSELGRSPVTLTVDRAIFAAEHRVVPAQGGETIELVSVGRALPGAELRIVGPDHVDLPPDRVGEIAIRGASVFAGYYRSPEADARPFLGDWYLTGDLGFIHEGHLYVTGRSKDIIIAYGKNFYSHDIEAIASRVAGVKAGRAVAFGVYNPRSGSEDVIVVAESDEIDPAAQRQIIRSVKASVAGKLDLSVASVALVPPRWLIKTTSGKVSRSQNREKYLNPRPATAATP